MEMNKYNSSCVNLVKNCVEKHAVIIIWCFGSYEPFNIKYIYIEYVSNIIKQLKNIEV